MLSFPSIQIEDALGGQPWQTAENLDLSFRRVARIENIVCLDKLLTLSLSNNRIKEIVNLSHLVSLTTLDLVMDLVDFNNSQRKLY